MITYSSMVQALLAAKPHTRASVWRDIAAETLQRGTCIEHRSAPLDFTDLAERLEASHG